jgi:hypothetical protein
MRRATMPSVLTCAIVCQACGSRVSSDADPQPPRALTPADSRRGETTPSEAPLPPIAPPSPGEQACVNQVEFQTYASALEGLATATRDRELAALGAQALARTGFVVQKPPGPTYEVKGRRFAVVGSATPGYLPGKTATAIVAKARDGTIHPFEPQVKVHGLTFTVCGLPCDPGRGALEPAPQALVIELADGETLGGTLRPAYEIWVAHADQTCHGMNSPPS